MIKGMALIKRGPPILWLGLLLSAFSTHSNALDPMAPPGYSASGNRSNEDAGRTTRFQRNEIQQPSYVVQQVFVKGEHRRAVINDQVVAEGDRVGSARVISIATTAVVIREQGKQTVLPVQDDYPKVRQ